MSGLWQVQCGEHCVRCQYIETSKGFNGEQLTRFGQVEYLLGPESSPLHCLLVLKGNWRGRPPSCQNRGEWRWRRARASLISRDLRVVAQNRGERGKDCPSSWCWNRGWTTLEEGSSLLLVPSGWKKMEGWPLLRRRLGLVPQNRGEQGRRKGRPSSGRRNWGERRWREFKGGRECERRSPSWHRMGTEVGQSPFWCWIEVVLASKSRWEDEKGKKIPSIHYLLPDEKFDDKGRYFWLENCWEFLPFGVVIVYVIIWRNLQPNMVEFLTYYPNDNYNIFTSKIVRNTCRLKYYTKYRDFRGQTT